MNNVAFNLIKSAFQTSPNRLYTCLYYKSALSLEHLYPNSSLKLTTPLKPPNDGKEQFTGYIPIDQLSITYSHSSGPGGQNVNKVNTKVEVHFHIDSATWISEDVKTQLQEKLKNKVTKEGFAVFQSDLTRSQHLNLADCLEKIRSSIRNCIVIESKPSEETVERIRRRHEKATRERLAIKRERSQVKNDRQAPEVNF